MAAEQILFKRKLAGSGQSREKRLRESQPVPREQAVAASDQAAE